MLLCRVIMEESNYNLTIHEFQEIRDIKLNKIGQVNILVGVNGSGKTRMIKAIEIYYNHSSIRYISPHSYIVNNDFAFLLSKVIKQNFKDNIIELLQEIDENISDLEILNSPVSGFEVYIQHNKLGLTPVTNLGDGIRRLLYISLMIIQVKGGVLLIDEIESSIHTEVLKTSMQWLIKCCKKLDIQLEASQKVWGNSPTVSGQIWN